MEYIRVPAFLLFSARGNRVHELVTADGKVSCDFRVGLTESVLVKKTSGARNRKPH